MAASVLYSAVLVATPDRVLCVIPDPMLLKLRQLLLETAGYSVLPASSVEQALGLMAKGNFDLLLIGCNVVGEARQRLLRQQSKVPTVVLYCGQAPDVSANAVCDCLDDPKLLVDTIQSLLIRTKTASSRRSANGFTRIALDGGIAVSVCTYCYRFVTYGSHEGELQKLEQAHVCAEMQER